MASLDTALKVIPIINNQTLDFISLYLTPRGPTQYFTDRRGGGPRDIFGSEILAKTFVFESMKDAGIFLGHKKTQLRDVFGVL